MHRRHSMPRGSEAGGRAKGTLAARAGENTQLHCNARVRTRASHCLSIVQNLVDVVSFCTPSLDIA